ncbi:hypothetical protein NW764_008807 [Fusarium oxysporum]|nr:hypothetical protein NW764_008807 [Fusarium oxysporum]
MSKLSTEFKVDIPKEEDGEPRPKRPLRRPLTRLSQTKILVAPARDAVRGTEASADDGIGEEIFGLSISPPLPWFAGMLSQYNKWVEQLPEVHRLEKYREETCSELEGLHADQFRHEKVQVAFEREYLGYHVREYAAWFNALYSAAHGTATADDGNFANGQLEAEGGHMEMDIE